MQSVTATLGFTPADVQAAQLPVSYQVTLTKDGTPGQPTKTTESSIVFELDGGSYVATVITLDSAGNAVS